MQLLYPFGLLALAGLVIPLVIHLWNVKKGKTIKIGSIAFLSEGARTSSKSLRITDVLLWMLRSFLVALLAIILAQPSFFKNQNENQQSGWILVDPHLVNIAAKQYGREIDSLTKKGFELRYFSPGFEKFTLENNNDPLKASTGTLSYTSLISQLNAEIPANRDIYLYADKRLVNLGEQLPSVSYQFYLKAINLPDTIVKWSAELAGKKYEGSSSSTFTKYKALDKKDSATSVVWFEKGNSSDIDYVIAALNAIADFTERKITISKFDPSKSIKADIGLWLSDDPINSSFAASVKQDGTLLNYEKGILNTSKSFLNAGVDSKQPIQLKKRVEVKQPTAKAIWTDGFGHPILTMTKSAGRRDFHFYGRFNIDWNDLVWNDQFVEALLPIAINTDETRDFGFENSTLDQRVFVGTKLVSHVQNSDFIQVVAPSESISYIFWLLSFVILTLERVLTFKKNSHAKS